MAMRTIRYGNDDILRKKCKEVAEVDNRIRMYLDDMLDTLLKLVNPVIIEASGTQECVEGCLSFPDIVLHC